MNPLSFAVLVPLSEDITRPEDYNPGWGLLILVVFLVIAVVVLALSFRKQVRKADRHFLGPEDGAESSDSQGGNGDRRE